MTSDPLETPAPKLALASAQPRVDSRSWEAAELIWVYAANHRPTVAEVVKNIGLPQEAVETTWRQLLEMGLLREVADGRYTAVDPESALAMTLERQKTLARARLEEIRGLTETVNALAEVFRPAAARIKADITVERYDARALRDNALLDLNAAARESTDSMHPGQMPADFSVLERSLQMDAEMIARGVGVRAIYPQSLLQTPRYAKYLRDLAAVGAAVRVVDHAPHDLLIFDRHTVMLPGDPEENSKTMIKVTGLLVRPYVATYEDFWKRGIPVGMLDAGADELVLRSQERSIFLLLLQGLSDDQVARTLGIHRRTVQRRVTETMERLGVTSRIELGYHLRPCVDTGQLKR